MDCDKFESVILDELYGELDEVTSAAAKRHLAGCARCSSLLNGLRATRSALATQDAAATWLAEPPADLEQKILARAAEAQKVVPLRSRWAGAIALAGSWAMRPQTAAAAVFLLMVGSSLVLVRSSSREGAVIVHDMGSPAPAPVALAREQTPPGSGESIDSVLEEAHGAKRDLPRAKVAADPEALALNPASPTAPSIRRANGGKGESDLLGLDNKDDRPKAGARSRAEPYALADNERSLPADALNYAGPTGSPPPPSVAGGGRGDGLGAIAAAPPASQPTSNQPKPKEATKPQVQEGAPLEQAQGRSPSQSPAQELASLRTEKKQAGCSRTVSQLDALARTAAGTSVGREAQLEAARCYAEMGQQAAARARLVPLSQAPDTARVATEELRQLDRQAVPTQVQTAPAAPPAKAAASKK